MTALAPARTSVTSIPRRRVRPAVILAAAYLALMLAWAVAPGAFTSGTPYDTDIENPLKPPSFEHWFGTDASGRDIFTRVVYGTQSSLAIGVGATALALLAAIILGFGAGLGGRFADGAISRFIEVVLSIPGLLLALVFIAMFGPGVVTQILAVAIGSAVGYARMVRGQVIAVKDSGYVHAATALGHSRGQIIRRHVFPNAMRPLVVLGTMGIGQSIVWASSLSFLGLGVAPPARSGARCSTPAATSSPPHGGWNCSRAWPSSAAHWPSRWSAATCSSASKEDCHE